MDFYHYNLIAFVLLNTCLVYWQYRRDGKSKGSKETVGTAEREKQAAGEAMIWHFKKRYLPVYMLVVGADWLQVGWPFPVRDVSSQFRVHIFIQCTKVSLNYRRSRDDNRSGLKKSRSKGAIRRNRGSPLHNRLSSCSNLRFIRWVPRRSIWSAYCLSLLLCGLFRLMYDRSIRLRRYIILWPYPWRTLHNAHVYCV